jgi:putative hydrolase of the HAD superfamily
MIQAVLFDAVGTLIHLREPVGETYARVARQHGVAVQAAGLQAAFPRVLRAMPPMVCSGPDRRQVIACERAWWRSVVRSVFEAAGAASQGDDFDRVFDRLFALYATAAAWRSADGAAPALAAVRARGLHTGMVSNFDHRLPPLLAALGLAPLLDVVVLPADAGAAKPDPRIFACALRRLGAAAAASVYVGDDAHDDIAGARNAGLHAIDVTSLPDLRALGAAIDALERAPVRRARTAP